MPKLPVDNTDDRVQYDLQSSSTVVGKRRTRRMHHFSFLLLLFFVYLVWHKKSASQIAVKDVDGAEPCIGGGFLAQDFDWSSIVPSETLHWVACYDKFQCARLSVPLDYSEPDGEKAAVALTKLPSKVLSNNERYRGPILFNPGGPGGSGVDFILRPGIAENFRAIIGEEYDLIGFDPRGLGRTTPAVKIFPTKFEQAAWALQGIVDAKFTPENMGHQLSMARVLGQIAEDRVRHAAEHISTAVVARDMLSIVKAHGRDKLQYWGFSYGTVLGATFAAMFPDYVGRLIIDGVVDSENYYAALWDNNLRDAEAGLHRLYEACVEAGPSLCPIYEETAKLIDERVKALIDKLSINPAPFFNATDGSYNIVDGQDVKDSLLWMLNKPYTGATAYLTALVELEKGNVAPIANSIFKADYLSYAIACGDGDEVHDSVPELLKHGERIAKSSPLFASTWATERTMCAGWKIRAKERFTGPFVANTSHPLLLIGNAADPVTPVWNAHKMSCGFKDSVVLTQNSIGHCSNAATSLCTVKYIRQYFRDGILPSNDTVCEIESPIFGDELNVDMKVLSLEDRRLLWASRELQKSYFVPRKF